MNVGKGFKSLTPCLCPTDAEMRKYCLMRAHTERGMGKIQELKREENTHSKQEQNNKNAISNNINHERGR